MTIPDKIVEKALRQALFENTRVSRAWMRKAIAAILPDLTAAAVAREREECAKIAEDAHRRMDGYEIACAIRARSNTP